MTQIVCFAGKKQSGKTTACEFVAEQFPGKKIGFYNFADPLKELCMEILGLSHQQCYGENRHKNEVVDCYWNGKQLTAREVMQIVGTDWLRTMQDHVWASATIRKIQKENPEIALVGDCRFPNEVEAVQNAGGIVIKLERAMYYSDHPSEVALDRNNYDPLKFDGVVQNQYMELEGKNETILRMLKTKGVL